MRELTFQLAAETKGALRYSEVLPNGRNAQSPNDEGAIVGTLYVRKTTFPGGKFPSSLKVSITTNL